MFQFPPGNPEGRRAARRARTVRPVVEDLESRKLLYATTGDAWTMPVRVTYSFAPDGTSIGGVASSLFSAMNAKGISAATLEAQFEKAAAVWEAVAGVNLVPVSDNGSAYGVSGYQQGDTRFGDIRIGGLPLPTGTLAETFLPPPDNGGTLAGDIVVNTNQSWHVNSDYDVETVAIHELGHALGMGHSAITAADMYAYYSGVRQSLNADDTSGIQSIYGPPTPDRYDAGVGNGSFGTAANVVPLINGAHQAVVSGLSLTSATDSDYFYVAAPSGGSGTFTVTMQSTNLSSLAPKLIVYDASQHQLASISAANTYGSTISVSVGGVTAGQGFYVKAAPANVGAGSAGAYGLSLNFGSGTMPPIAPPNTQVASASGSDGGSLGESSDPGTATSLGLSLGLSLGRGGLGLNLGLGNLGVGVGVGGGEGLLHIVIGTLDGIGDTLTTPAHGPHSHARPTPRPLPQHHSHSPAPTSTPGHHGHVDHALSNWTEGGGVRDET